MKGMETWVRENEDGGQRMSKVAGRSGSRRHKQGHAHHQSSSSMHEQRFAHQQRGEVLEMLQEDWTFENMVLVMVLVIVMV